MRDWTGARGSFTKRLAVAAVTAATTLGLIAGAPALADPVDPEYTVTLVRHGESEGNASGLIDTKTPGPNLTETGQLQARQISELLGPKNFDGVYASRMVRTQQTAAPISRKLRKPVTVLPGVHEILAGTYEGTPEADAVDTYFAAPIQWMGGNLGARIPDGPVVDGEDGYGFLNRYSGSLQQIVNAGKKNAVVFSHVGAISAFAMIGTTNGLQYAGNAQNDRLKNVGYVVLKGKPGEWRITEWVGNPQLPDLTGCTQVVGSAFGSVGGSLAPC